MFNWSFTRLKDWETCPRWYNVKHIQKIKEPENEQAKEGKLVHAALEQRVVYKKPLPPQYADLERYGVAGDAARAAGFQIVGEQQWAIDSNFMPCGWKEWDVAWCRVILDLGIIGKRDALLIDYKTGRPRTEPTQLALFAAVGFIHLPQVDTIQTRFVWTQGAKPHTSEYRRENVDGIWSDILPRVARMRQGIEKRAFDPTPNGLCKEYCPVLTCQHNGRRNG